MANWAKPVVCALTLLLSISACLDAQSQVTTGSIEGVVRSEAGVLLPEASVSLRNRDNGVVRQVQTDRRGQYRVILLPLGAYDVDVQRSGFASTRRAGVQLAVAQALNISFRLKPSTTSEPEDGPAVQPVSLDTGRSYPGASINRTFVENLPMIGRKFLDLGVLVPGGTESGDRDTSATAVFSGVNQFYTNLTVDGAAALQGWSSLPRGKFLVPYEFSPNAIREFQVLQSDFPAEFGRSAGGMVNAVTKSGTNEWHGDASYYISDSAWNATQRFAASKPDARQQQFGGSLGGPLASNEIFLFTNYDQQIADLPVIVDRGTVLDGFETTLASIANAAERQRFIQAGDFIRSQLGVFDRDLGNRTFLAKIDWHASPRHHLSGRYNVQDFDGTNLPENGFAVPTASGMAMSNLGNVAVRNHTAVFQWNAQLTPDIFNEVRTQFALGRERETTEASGPQVRVGNNRTGFTFGQRQNFPTLLRERRWQVAEIVTVLRGQHEIRAGGDIDHVNDQSVTLPISGGAYQFNNLRNFANGRYMSFMQAFGTAQDEISSPYYGLFIQDNIKIRPNFNLNIGVRYEFQDLAGPAATNPQFAQTGQFRNDKNNVAPRLGFSWSPESQDLVVRGSYGIYHATLPLLVNSYARMQNGISQILQTYRGAADPRGASPGAPEYPAILSPQLPGPGADIVVFSPDFADPYEQHANLQVERRVFSDLSASVGWLFSKGTRLRRNEDINLFPPVLRSFQVQDTARGISGTIPILSFGGPVSRPNPYFNQIDEFKFDSSSIYHALVLEAKKPYGNRLQFLFNYTFSKLIDYGEAPGGQTLCCTSENQFAVANERGLGRRDQKHRVNFAAVWDLPGLPQGNRARAIVSGWRLSGTVKAGSGRPITPTVTGDVGGDVNGDGVRGDRAPIFGRSSFTGPGYASTDISLDKTLFTNEQKRLGFVFQVFNLFNRSNYIRLVTDYFNMRTLPDGSYLLEGPLPTFATPQDATRSREVQVALKFEF